MKLLELEFFRLTSGSEVFNYRIDAGHALRQNLDHTVVGVDDLPQTGRNLNGIERQCKFV